MIGNFTGDKGDGTFLAIRLEGMNMSHYPPDEAILCSCRFNLRGVMPDGRVMRFISIFVSPSFMNDVCFLANP